MSRKLLLTLASLVLALSLAACSREANDSSSPASPSESMDTMPTDLGILPVEPSYDLVVSEGIDLKRARALVNQLPADSIAGADLVVVADPALGDFPSQGPLVFITWKTLDGPLTRIWDLDPAKSQTSPLFTISGSSEKECRVYEGSDQEMLRIVEGLVEYQTPERATTEVLCALGHFVVDILCPLISGLHPVVGVLCTIGGVLVDFLC